MSDPKWFDTGSFLKLIALVSLTAGLLVAFGLNAFAVPRGEGLNERFYASWEDLRFPLSSFGFFSPNPPDNVQVIDDGSGSTGVYYRCFSPTVEEEGFVYPQMPHGWLPEDDIKPHFHYFQNAAGTGDVVWGIECGGCGNMGDALGNTTIVTVTDAVPGTILERDITSTSAMDMTGCTLSATFGCRVFRDATNAADTFAGDVCLEEFDLHYRTDRRGTDLEFSHQ